MLLLIMSLFALLTITGIPIAFSMGFAATLGLIKASLPLILIPQRIFTGIDSFPLLAIPFFILAGEVMDTAGISIRLVNLARAMVGHLRGGLGQVVIVAEIFFSGISGATAADVAAMGSILIPAMEKAGFRTERATAIVCAACGMGILVPPCLAMVIYGVISGVSIGALFAAGFLPAFAMALALGIQIYIQARRENMGVESRWPLKKIWVAFRDSILALMTPVIIMGGILGGIFTPTESAVFAIVYGIIIGMFVYKEVKVTHLAKMLVNTAVTSGQVMLLVGVASVFQWLLSAQKVPQALAETMISWSSSPLFFLILTNVFFLFIGAILEGVPALIMLVPVLLPVAQKFGVDPLHFGIILIANLGIGLFLPPIGLALYIGCGVGKVSVGKVTSPLLPYLIVMFAMVLLISFFPKLTLIVPQWLFGTKNF